MSIKPILAIEDAVEEFATDMRFRLFSKMDEGRSGWDDPEVYSNEKLATDIEDVFRRYLAGETDEINVANYLMFSWKRKTND